MLVRTFERQNAAWFDDVGLRRRPVVTMFMPLRSTETQLFDQLLVALDAPAASHFICNYPFQEAAGLSDNSASG